MSALAALAACAPPDELPPAQRTLVVHERVYVDPDRETPAVGVLPAAADRTLRTLVWVGPATPEEAPVRPLLLLAHGNDGLPEKFTAFASDLAEDGIVVAAPAFPLTHEDSGAGLAGPIVDLPNQPGDLGFVLGKLRREAEDRSSDLWHRFDPDAVAVLGHSVGAATVLGWTRYDDPDPRVRATALLAAATPLATAFGPTPSPEGPPTLVLHGTLDTTVDQGLSEALYDSLDDPAWFLGIEGAAHSDAIEGQEEPPSEVRRACMDATRALVDEAVLGRAGAVGRALDTLEAAGHAVGR